MKKTDASESLFDEILSEDDEDSYAMADIFEDDSEQEEQESDLIKENSVLSKRVEDLTSSYLNLAADFENFKKRNTKNLEDSRKFALESIMKDLIEVLDNFERALASSDNEGGDKNLIEGIKNTHRQLMTLLESHGLSKIPTEPGMEFDPHFHESVLQIPTNDAPEETIMEVFKSGYTFNSKVIRPAMVTISSPVEDE